MDEDVVNCEKAEELWDQIYDKPKNSTRKVYIGTGTKFINMTAGTPFEGMPTELVEAISDGLHEAASMFRGPFIEEVDENETDNN